LERTIANLSNQVEQYKSNAKESKAIVNNMMKEDVSASKSTKRSLFDRSPKVRMTSVLVELLRKLINMNLMMTRVVMSLMDHREIELVVVVYLEVMIII
jgi:hypothetical protein